MEGLNSLYHSSNTIWYDSPSIQTTKTSLRELSDILQVECIEGSSSQQLPLYQSLLQHRQDYYRGAAPHLMTPLEQQAEYEVDQRSRLYLVIHNGQILTSLRLTRRPFELENFGISEFDERTFSNYWELGRLVINCNLEPLTAALVVRFLLCATGLNAIEEFNCQGLVAICRPHRLSYFKKFGLQEITQFKSPTRNIDYIFMSAPMNYVLQTTSELQVSEKLMRQRLSRVDFSKVKNAKMD